MARGQASGSGPVCHRCPSLSSVSSSVEWEPATLLSSHVTVGKPFTASQGTERRTRQALPRSSQSWCQGRITGGPQGWDAPLCAGHRAPHTGSEAAAGLRPPGRAQLPSLKTGRQRWPPIFPTPLGRKIISADSSVFQLVPMPARDPEAGPNSGRSELPSRASGRDSTLAGVGGRRQEQPRRPDPLASQAPPPRSLHW